MGFSLPQLNSCCCGCSLRTGTLIILWLTVIGSLLTIVVIPLVPLDYANPTTPSHDRTHNKVQTVDWNQISPFGPIWGMIFGIISLVAGSVALYGVYKELHLYLTPYLSWIAAYEFVLIVAALIKDFSAGTIFTTLIGFLISFYFWLVVFSHYRVLKGSARPIQA